MDLLNSLLKPKVNSKNGETFVDDTTAQNIVGTTYIVIGCMLLAVVLTLLLYWSYSKNVNLFAGILWTIVLLYTAGNVTFIGISKSRLQPFAFKFFIALHTIMGILSIGLLIFYFVKGSSLTIHNSNSIINSSSGYSGQSYYNSQPSSDR